MIEPVQAVVAEWYPPLFKSAMLVGDVVRKSVHDNVILHTDL